MTGGRSFGRNQSFFPGIDIDRIYAADPDRNIIEKPYYSIPASGKTVGQFAGHGQGVHTVSGRERINCPGEGMSQRIDALPQRRGKLVLETQYAVFIQAGDLQVCAAYIPTCIIFRMHIIPVIDLKDGLVVAARQGKRHTYRPLASPLCPEPEITAVVRAYLSVYPFRTFYIADLNAIENNGNNHSLITRILQTHSDISLWIDAGLDPFINGKPGTFRARVSNILGSETGIAVEQLNNYMCKSDCILSLDYAGGRFLGNMDLLEQPALLPRRVIVMSLERVGTHAGPDLEHISSLMERLPGKQVYAAGGVRNPDDLRLLADHGLHGALVATALHNKTITSGDLVRLQPK